MWPAPRPRPLISPAHSNGDETWWPQDGLSPAPHKISVEAGKGNNPRSERVRRQGPEPRTRGLRAEMSEHGTKGTGTAKAPGNLLRRVLQEKPTAGRPHEPAAMTHMRITAASAWRPPMNKPRSHEVTQFSAPTGSPGSAHRRCSSRVVTLKEGRMSAIWRGSPV